MLVIREGIQVHLNPDIDSIDDLEYYEPTILKAKQRLAAMKASQPDIAIKRQIEPGEFEVRSEFGVDKIILEPVPLGEEGEREGEDIRRITTLVIGFELATSATGTLRGWWVPDQTPVAGERDEGSFPEGKMLIEPDPDKPVSPYLRYAYDAPTENEFFEIRRAQDAIFTPERRGQKEGEELWQRFSWEITYESLRNVTITNDVTDDSDYQSNTSGAWTPGDYVGNPWYDGPEYVAGDTLYGPNLAGTFWFNDAYVIQECIAGSRDGILRDKTLWEFYWPKTPKPPENVTNMAVVSGDIWFFGRVVGRSGYYTRYYDKDYYCVEYDAVFTTLCWPCENEWVWPTDGVQEYNYTSTQTDVWTIEVANGFTVYGDYSRVRTSYIWWQGVYEDSSYKVYHDDCVGDLPWYDYYTGDGNGSVDPAAGVDFDASIVMYRAYSYDYHFSYTISPHDADPPPQPGLMPYTWVYKIYASTGLSLTLYERYIDNYDEPECYAIQCEVFDYLGSPMIVFSFVFWDDGSGEMPSSERYIQGGVIMPDGTVFWSERYRAYGYGMTGGAYFVVRQDGQFVGYCYGFFRPFVRTETRRTKIQEEGA